MAKLVLETQRLQMEAAEFACKMDASTQPNYSQMDLAASSDEEGDSRVKKVRETKPSEQQVFAALQSRLEDAENRASRNLAPKYQPDEKGLTEYMHWQLCQDKEMSPEEAARTTKLDLRMDRQLPLETTIPVYRKHKQVLAPNPAPPAILHEDESDEDESDEDKPLAKRLERFQACAGKPSGSKPTNTEKEEIQKEEKPKIPITHGQRVMAVTVMRDDEDTDPPPKKPKRKRMK